MHGSMNIKCRLNYPLITSVITLVPIPVASRSKAWVCGRSLAGIAGSNLARRMDVYLMKVLFVVR